MESIIRITILTLLILSGCNEDYSKCDIANRHLDECFGFMSINETYESDMWKNFSYSHNIKMTNYEWCMKIMNCEVSIKEVE